MLATVAAILLILPSAISPPRVEPAPRGGWRLLEEGAVFAAAGCAAAYVFGRTPDEAGRIPPATWLNYPAVFWAALRFGPRTTALAVLELGVIAMAMSRLGRGPYMTMHPDPTSAARALNVYLSLAAVIPL